MRKTLIVLSIALAAASISVTSAQAKGKGRGFGIGVGVGLLIGGALLHRHHHHHHVRPIVVPRPVVVQPVPQAVAAPVVRASDGLGRMFDVASGTWFDGRDRCWSAAQGWAFKGGSWFYGQAPWYERNGQWMTNAANPPTQIDCAKVPAFAARLLQGVEKTAAILKPTSAEHGASPADVVPGTPEGQRVGAQSAELGTSSGRLAASVR